MQRVIFSNKAWILRKAHPFTGAWVIAPHTVWCQHHCQTSLRSGGSFLLFIHCLGHGCLIFQRCRLGQLGVFCGTIWWFLSPIRVQWWAPRSPSLELQVSLVLEHIFYWFSIKISCRASTGRHVVSPSEVLVFLSSFLHDLIKVFDQRGRSFTDIQSIHASLLELVGKWYQTYYRFIGNRIETFKRDIVYMAMAY